MVYLVVYTLAILFSAFVCDIFIEPFVTWMKKYAKENAPEQRKNDFIPHYPKLTQLQGMVERGIYTASWLFGHPEFIAFWLTLKVAGNWGDWSGGGQDARAKFLIFLTGSGISVLMSVLIAIIAEYFLSVVKIN